MEKGLLEFDWHTHSRPCQNAIDRMSAYFTKRGSEADLQPLYDLVDASPEDAFVFTSSGAEAVSQVIWSVYSEAARKEGKTQLITSCLEDAPTLQMLKRCETLGCKAVIAPVDAHGRIDLQKLSALITPRTALITLPAAQGLTGVIQPIEEIARIAKEKKVLLHLDASYAIGKTYFSFRNLGLDYLTFAGERIHSVKGSGALFAKKGRPLIPFILGKEQDTPSLYALIAAASLAHLALDSSGLEGTRLRDLFETEVQKFVPHATPFFKEVPRLPNTTAIEFPRVHFDALQYYLKRQGLFSNTSGLSCQHLHSLLAASGIQSESALSFSLSRMTTQEEVLLAAKLIGQEVAMLQKLTEDLF